MTTITVKECLEMIQIWKEGDCLSNPKNCISDCAYRKECEKVSKVVNEGMY